MNSKRGQGHPPLADSWEELDLTNSLIYIRNQDGLTQKGKIEALPGQPQGVDFDHYVGYATVDPNVGKALFYCFVESAQDSAVKPLVLWLNGGTGIKVFAHDRYKHEVAYGGDIDVNVPVASSKYAINTPKLPIKTAWGPWYTSNQDDFDRSTGYLWMQDGGYVVDYEGMAYVTIRGAGHDVPNNQPERALTMISSFLQGVLPPSST
ncbi:hypothetical protein Ancab_011388 [Ancistrocladus abbreviatus]